MSDTRTIVVAIIGTGIAMTTVIVSFVAVVAGGINTRIDDLTATVNSRFDDVNARIDDVNARIDEVNTQISTLKTNVRELRGLVIEAT